MVNDAKDIRGHLHMLTDLWRPALAGRRPAGPRSRAARLRRWLGGSGAPPTAG